MEQKAVDFLHVAAPADMLQLAPVGSASAIILKARTAHVVPSLGRVDIPTGVRVWLPYQTFGYIAGRSALLSLYGIEVASSIIEEGFHRELVVTVLNVSAVTCRLEKGEAIGSLVVVPYVPVVVKEESLATFARVVQGKQKDFDE